MTEEKELEEKVLFINRCTKVLKGGRKFSFSALVIVGDGEQIGYGFAKANEVSDAIKKASQNAKKELFSFSRENTTIPHEVLMEWDGAKILLKPAAEGRGVVAGSVVRSVLELAGIKDVVAKSLGSNNPTNMVRATIKALQSLCDRETCLTERGIA